MICKTHPPLPRVPLKQNRIHYQAIETRTECFCYFCIQIFYFSIKQNATMYEEWFCASLMIKRSSSWCLSVSDCLTVLSACERWNMSLLEVNKLEIWGGDDLNMETATKEWIPGLAGWLARRSSFPSLTYAFITCRPCRLFIRIIVEGDHV